MYGKSTRIKFSNYIKCVEKNLVKNWDTPRKSQHNKTQSGQTIRTRDLRITSKQIIPLVTLPSFETTSSIQYNSCTSSWFLRHFRHHLKSLKHSFIRYLGLGMRLKGVGKTLPLSTQFIHIRVRDTFQWRSSCSYNINIYTLQVWSTCHRDSKVCKK